MLWGGSSSFSYHSSSLVLPKWPRQLGGTIWDPLGAQKGSFFRSRTVLKLKKTPSPHFIGQPSANFHQFAGDLPYVGTMYALCSRQSQCTFGYHSSSMVLPKWSRQPGAPIWDPLGAQKGSFFRSRTVLELKKTSSPHFIGHSSANFHQFGQDLPYVCTV